WPDGIEGIDGGRARRAATALARLRVPLVPVPACADRAGERHAAAGAGRRRRCGWTRARMARTRRTFRASVALSKAAFGRRAATRRDRARVLRRATGADG